MQRTTVFSLRLSEDEMAVLQAEAKAQERSVSWLIRRKLFPGMPVGQDSTSRLMSQTSSTGVDNAGNTVFGPTTLHEVSVHPTTTQTSGQVTEVRRPKYTPAELAEIDAERLARMKPKKK